jgi:hypothetical protein
MRSFLFVIIFMITSLALSAQNIADVKQIGSSTLVTMKSNGAEISRRTLNNYETLSGYSSSIVVITVDKRTAICYDENFKELSRRTLNDGDFVKSVSGENIIIKTSMNVVITYDKNFRELSRRND